MASPLFKTSRINVPTGQTTASQSSRVNTINESGGIAYAMTHQHALAQYATTGMLDGYLHIDGQTQLSRIIDLAEKCSNKYVAQVAIYAHEKGFMKDIPALLLGYLMKKDRGLFNAIFKRVITNGRMLRTFVQIIRSGTFGTRSFGTNAKHQIQDWLNSTSDKTIINASIGNDPSLKDIIKMVHPKAPNENRNQLYRWVCDMDYQEDKLPEQLQLYLKLKRNPEKAEELPDLPFQMYTSMGLTTEGWRHIAKNATWNQTRMNLATFERHGVFGDKSFTNKIAEKLTSERDIIRSKAMPFAIFSAFKKAGDISYGIRKALNEAAEISLQNVPKLEGKTVVAIDRSGSMSWLINSRSTVRVMDVAAVLVAALKNKNPDLEIILFNHTASIYEPKGKTLFGISEELSRMASGGTDCGAAMAFIKDRYANTGMPDNIIMVSDNESWLSTTKNFWNSTGTVDQLKLIRKQNPNTRMINIDVTPGSSSQTVPEEYVLNIGGFNDAVFQVASLFFNSKGNKDFWVSEINKVEI